MIQRHQLFRHEPHNEIYGPSLMDGSRTFHETYGTDDELIDQQTFVNEQRQAA